MQFHTKSCCYVSTNNKPPTHFITPVEGTWCCKTYYVQLAASHIASRTDRLQANNVAKNTKKCKTNAKTLQKHSLKNDNKNTKQMPKHWKKTQKHLYTQLNQCQDIQTNAKTLQKCTLASKNRIASNPLKGKFIPSALFSLKFIQKEIAWYCMKTNEAECHTPRPMSTLFMSSKNIVLSPWTPWI